MQLSYWGRSALMSMLAASLWGCATPKPPLAPPTATEMKRGRYARMDDFGLLLVDAAVELEDIPEGHTLSAAQMEALQAVLRLKLADGNMNAYGPRVLAYYLLEGALKQGPTASRDELGKKLNGLMNLAVMNPQGMLVYASSGTCITWVGTPRVSNGVPQAGAYKVDAFYVKVGKVYQQDPRFVAPVLFGKPPPPPAPKPAPLTTATAP